MPDLLIRLIPIHPNIKDATGDLPSKRPNLSWKSISVSTVTDQGMPSVFTVSSCDQYVWTDRLVTNPDHYCTAHMVRYRGIKGKSR